MEVSLPIIKQNKKYTYLPTLLPLKTLICLFLSLAAPSTTLSPHMPLCHSIILPLNASIFHTLPLAAPSPPSLSLNAPFANSSASQRPYLSLSATFCPCVPPFQISALLYPLMFPLPLSSYD